ncbi:KUP/HAK/KT family potassium transporter, partial [Ideonella azotifigens]
MTAAALPRSSSSATSGFAPPQGQPRGRALAGLTLAAVGVVYGDIGTSPLYTVKEVFGAGGVPLTSANLVGAVSAILWALMLVVTLKYV